MSNDRSTEGPRDDIEVNIPEPAGLPLLGNIMAIDSEFPLGSMKALSDEYGM
jgi:cytochrome P450 / NADPH-cytochrome P450 reductase